MNTIDDSQPIVPRGLNYDTVSRYVSRAVCAPLLSYLVVNVLARRLDKHSSTTTKDRIAVAAALWATIRYVVPVVGKLPCKILGLGQPPVQWSSEIVVVTGGSHGVGLELTKRLLRAGAQVAILDVNPFPIDEESINDPWRYYRCDITDLEQVKAAADRIRADLGHPTMLVNNAGIVVGKLLLDMTDGEVDKVVDVNLTSHFHLIRQFLPAMLEAKRGHIVTIGSIVSFAGTPQASTYCATKGGVKLLHESLRREVASRYGPNDIQFSIAYPGVINTGLFKGLDLGRFFLPNLRPDSLARTIFAALGSGKGQEIYIPKAANMLSIIYAFPQGMRSRLINLVAGGDQAMSGFSGHTKY
ncbi:hypothetical protein GGI25_001528 [Coemansia spiralis]|uniref:Uncharacterized protein n=2 Tax=Coemansia TaxID=4863 RepID=A0A9W8GAG0_9FUNG|nr:hypothetical protein BX070DRAFT_226997 [Coemansia spiralis]KAJ1993638.1 hypothetical protein EDC05_002031 [Coemansia umbellata]KAJ2622995.1 hypothetical protein GGI26_002796 [Coemansia sp. RSA 1358]KAJ2679393.1 hypothetical protein GGI25_001528 [Coemansia spiralis]